MSEVGKAPVRGLVVALRSVFAKLALLFGSLALCLLLAELAARGALTDRYYLWPPNLSRTFHAEDGEASRGATRFTINDFGVRGDAYHDENVLRIMAAGGSTTICALLDDGDAWPHLAQELVNAELGAQALWVGNVGRLGHTTAQHLLQVERLLDQHSELDAVLLLVGANDMLIHLSLARGLTQLRLVRSATDRARGGTFSAVPLDPATPWYRPAGIVEWLARRGWITGSTDPFELPIVDTGGDFFRRQRHYRKTAGSLRNDLPPLDDARRAYATRLNKIADAAKARGASAIFITQPSLWRHDLSPQARERLWMGGPPLTDAAPGAEYMSVGALARAMAAFNETLLAVCEARRLDCLDAAELLPRNTSIFWDDVHFTRQGARRLAELLAKHLLATFGELRSPAR